MHRTFTALTAPLLMLGIANTAVAADPDVSPSQRIAALEAAHGGETYSTQDAVQADFEVNFGPMNLVGQMSFTPSMSRANVVLEDGTAMIFDGQTAWLSPAEAQVPGPPARFHVLTWPYFVAAPFKLDDPGTNPSDAGKLAVKDTDDLRVGTKISFDAGVGDAPDDWYIAFTDDRGRMDALAYIVSYGKTKEEAEAKPSIILYSDFVEVHGVSFATTWDFHFWDPATGLGEKKGSAKLSNIRFVTPDASAFTKPDGAIEAKAPAE